MTITAEPPPLTIDERFVQPGKQLTTAVSVILYGPPKIGKSTAAASAPGPILYLNADSPSAIRYARRRFPDTEILELGLDDDDDVRDTMGEAYLYAKDSGKVRTVVLDSLGRVYDVLLRSWFGPHPTLQNRGDVSTFIERWALGMLQLPVNVVLVAHDNSVKVSGDGSDEPERHELFPFTGTNNPSHAKKLMRAVDVVAYCGRTTPQEDGEESRYVAQLFNGGGRHGGDRTGVLGDSRPLDLSEWIAAVEAAYSPSNDKKETGE